MQNPETLVDIDAAKIPGRDKVEKGKNDGNKSQQENQNPEDKQDSQ